MAQMTWRASDEQYERVKRAAQRQGQSVNEYVTRVLDVATDPGAAGSEWERLRDRLAAAGLLAAPGAPRRRPPAERVASARSAAASGASLSGFVVDGR